MHSLRLVVCPTLRKQSGPEQSQLGHMGRVMTLEAVMAQEMRSCGTQTEFSCSMACSMLQGL